VTLPEDMPGGSYILSPAVVGEDGNPPVRLGIKGSGGRWLVPGGEKPYNGAIMSNGR
jgi:hypothetical protein